MNKFFKKILGLDKQCACNPKPKKTSHPLIDWNKARVEVLKKEADKVKTITKKDYAEIMKILRQKVK